MKRFALAGLLATLWMVPTLPAAENSAQLREDIRNHNRKIDDLIKNNAFEKVRAEAETLAEDVKALTDRVSELPERKRPRFNKAAEQALTLTKALSQNKGDPVAARANYKNLQLALTTMERAFAGSGSTDAKDKDGLPQLRRDIENHAQAVNRLVEQRKMDELDGEVEDLQNDLEAYLAQVKTEVDQVTEAAEELRTAARRGNQAQARVLAKKLQAAVSGSAGLRSEGSSQLGSTDKK